MANAKKVIKGLECCRIDENRHVNCADCPYYTDDDKGQMWCSNEINNDALELLKEQEQLKIALSEGQKQVQSLLSSGRELEGTINILKGEIYRLNCEIDRLKDEKEEAYER